MCLYQVSWKSGNGLKCNYITEVLHQVPLHKKIGSKPQRRHSPRGTVALITEQKCSLKISSWIWENNIKMDQKEMLDYIKLKYNTHVNWFQLVWDNVQWYRMAFYVHRRGEEGSRISDWLNNCQLLIENCILQCMAMTPYRLCTYLICSPMIE